MVQLLYYAIPKKAQKENRNGVDNIGSNYYRQYGAFVHTYFLLKMGKSTQQNGGVGGEYSC
ncbi:MAG: hypothetical protein KAR00_01700 [Candidatus Pacebacteria bacterium]|nr:hypothetical protein [Candidatus Paceibacterota bacterium]